MDNGNECTPADSIQFTCFRFDYKSHVLLSDCFSQKSFNYFFFVRNLANTINCFTKTFDVVLVSFGLIVASVYTHCKSKRNNSVE